MKYVYPAIFHKEDESFWVEFPNLDGCQTYGDTLEEVIVLSSDVLGIYLATKLDNNIPFPLPSYIGDLKVDETCFTSYITCDITKYRNKNRAVKKTLSIPQWLNEESEKRNLNFSGVLKKALMKELEIDNRP